MIAIRTIVHPTDFSESSNGAFEFACALARDYSAKLIVLHVYPTPVLPTFDGGMFPIPMDVPREELMEALNQVKPDDPAIAIERVLVIGEPAYEIRRAADAYRADMIVMGTHGRGGLSRFVMGSVAEDVSRGADCPVLTVRPSLVGAREEPAKTVKREPVAVG